MGFNDDSPKGRDVKDTSMLNTKAREKYATGQNTTKRATNSGSSFGKLGAKGHP